MERGDIPRRRNLWGGTRHLEERIQRGEGEEKSEEGSTYQGAGSWSGKHGRSVNTRKDESTFVYSSVISVITRVFFYDINVKTIGMVRIKDTQIFSNKFGVRVDRRRFESFRPNKITVDKQRKTEEGRRGGGWVKRGRVEKRGA